MKQQRTMTQVQHVESVASSSEKRERKHRRERQRESARLGEELVNELDTPVVAPVEPKTKKSKKSKKEVENNVNVEIVETEPIIPVETTPVESTEKVEKKSKKSKKSKVVVEEEQIPLPVEQETTTTLPSHENVETEGQVPVSIYDLSFSKKKIVEKEDLEECFDLYAQALETELELSRQDKSRKVNVKTWRLLQNELKRLKLMSLRVMKKPKKRSENAQSGFMKPVRVSKQMAEFAGWNPNDLHSRVEVTKFICNYIKQNNLQNPADRRQILVDDRLSKLLNHTKNSDTPLTYYLLQKKIQPHFIL